MIRFTTTSKAFFTAAAIASVGILSGCSKKKEVSAPVQVEAAERRDIVITTEGTGTVEPVDTVAVKSQASGLIMKMPVEVGTFVKPGDLIAQIDTRNLQNDLTRAKAAAQAAESTVAANASALRRADTLYAQNVIATVELEAAKVNNANAQSALVASQTNLRVAQQNLEFATVRADVSGTIISKSASVGTVAASAISNVGGGSTLVTIADLSRVRMRVLVNETDIAQVRVGQAASVSIDAMPNRTFNGIVEKVEPKAVIQQSVTMFPVLVSLENADQTLLPGMNGEVSMIIQERRDAIAVPIDALRSRAELSSVASGLGISNDSIQAMLERLSTPPTQRGDSQPGVGSGAGGMGPAADSGRSSAANTAAGGNRAAAGARTRGGMNRGGQGGNSAGVGAGAGTGAAAARGGRNRRAQVLFAFVKTGNTYELRRVRVGVMNFDYAEVLDGINEGDQVALLSVAAAQGARNASADRVRSMTGTGIPGAPATGGRRGPR